MAKKSFKDGPALRFISEEPAAVEQPTPQEIPATGKAPKGYKVNPLYVETRSRRIQLVVQPSLYERIKARAAAEGISVNEYVHQVLDEKTKEE